MRFKGSTFSPPHSVLVFINISRRGGCTQYWYSWTSQAEVAALSTGIHEHISRRGCCTQYWYSWTSQEEVAALNSGIHKYLKEILLFNIQEILVGSQPFKNADPLRVSKEYSQDSTYVNEYECIVCTALNNMLVLLKHYSTHTDPHNSSISTTHTDPLRITQ